MKKTKKNIIPRILRAKARLEAKVGTVTKHNLRDLDFVELRARIKAQIASSNKALEWKD